MPRLLFEKTGNAVWMSHLDLMRLFQRAFKRAGLLLKHTQGFNPRPSVSIALPLSVGVESRCELLDFDLEGENASCDEICDLLNKALIEGVKVLKVYDGGRKLKELSLLSCNVTLEYDSGIPASAQQKLCELFARESVVVSKKTKNSMQEQNIIPMIRHLAVRQLSDKELCLDAIVCCQNPTLNPSQLVVAICAYLPELKPDFSRCSRNEILDQNEKVFR